jgi:hypothetical protein
MRKNLLIRRIRIRIRNTAVNRNIHIRDKLASDKINTKLLTSVADPGCLVKKNDHPCKKE